MPNPSPEGELLVGGAPEPADIPRPAVDERPLLSALACGVLVHDAAGAVVYANPAAERLIGVPADRLCGRTPLGALWTAADEDGQAVPEAESPPIVALRTGRPVLGRLLSFVGPDGERRWAELDARPGLDADGRVLRVVTTLVDAGARKAVERQIAGLGRFEAMRQLGEIAGGVAHDLNHYFGLVSGHAELALLAAEVQGAATPQLRAALEAVVRASHEGAEVVGRLLGAARPARGARPTRVVLGDLLPELVLLTQPKWREGPRAEGRPIHVQLDVEGDATVLAVEPDLREAVTNLLFNAVEAMPRGGTIQLAARRAGAEVQLRVADTGVGMPPEVLRRAFEPYFTTKGDRGTGLGLAVARALVEAQGGRVDVISTPNLGTTFTLTFPAAPPIPPSPASPRLPVSPSPRPPAAPRRVLVVDDRPENTELAAELLARAGHAVATAQSGEEALVRLADTPFDIVVTDLTMAGMTGLELAVLVRQRYPAVRLVLATGWGELDPAVVPPDTFDAVIAKPYRMAVLLEAVANPG